MSDIGGIFTTYDLVLMALAAGSPGLILGAVLGAALSPRRLRGALLAAPIGFALCLGAVLIWILMIK